MTLTTPFLLVHVLYHTVPCACLSSVCLTIPAAWTQLPPSTMSISMLPFASLCRYSGFFTEGGFSSSSRPWFLSFTFAVACCVIVSGCLAERTRLLVYPAYTGA